MRRRAPELVGFMGTTVPVILNSIQELAGDSVHAGRFRSLRIDTAAHAAAAV
jgi:hypothetical protein